jgi:lipoate-protein ligase B
VKNVKIQVQDWGLLAYSEASLETISKVGYGLDVITGKTSDQLIFVEHPAVYTIGLRPDAENHLTADEVFLKKNNIEVVKTNRGGDITLHSPGQLVVYPIVKLQKHDLHEYLRSLEEVIIRALGMLGLAAARAEGKTGVWVNKPAHVAGGKAQEKKIAAIGVAVRQWVAYHGMAINVCNDLSLFDGIVPCGLKNSEVTSLKNEGIDVTMEEVKEVMKAEWNHRP